MTICAIHRRQGRFPVYCWGVWNYEDSWHGSCVIACIPPHHTGTVLLRAERPRTPAEKKLMETNNAQTENIIFQNQKVPFRLSLVSVLSILQDDSSLMISIFDAAGSVPPPKKDGEVCFSLHISSLPFLVMTLTSR